jgi:hypothetical protein
MPPFLYRVPNTGFRVRGFRRAVRVPYAICQGNIVLSLKVMPAGSGLPDHRFQRHGLKPWLEPRVGQWCRSLRMTAQAPRGDLWCAIQ